MKRDFEIEYKKENQQDLPDLWSRIEPNLLERDAITEDMAKLEESISNTAVIIDDSVLETKENETETKIETGKNIRPLRKVVTRVVPFAAAVLVLFFSAKLIQSGLFFRGNMTSAPASEESFAASDATPAEEYMADEAATEEATEEADAASATMNIAPAQESENMATADEAAVEETAEEDSKRSVSVEDLPADYDSIEEFEMACFVGTDVPAEDDILATEYNYTNVLFFEVQRDDKTVLVKAYVTEDIYRKLQEKGCLQEGEQYQIVAAIFEIREHAENELEAGLLLLE